VAHARDAGKTVYYPRTAEDGLVFVAPGGAGLAPGPYGVPEPTAGVALPRDQSGVLFLVPGVAFDARGARLGRGNGDYDRALTRHGDGTRIGLAYELQVAERLPESAWDVRMHAVVTDTRVIESESGAKEARPWS
jgi:5-formyltetrahydrofolate cyclo-ligase